MKGNKKYFRFGIICGLVCIVFGITMYFLLDNLKTMQAGYEQNDSEGYFVIDFINNQLGISEASPNIDIATSQGYVTLLWAIGETWHFTTSPITPVSFSAWENINYDATYMNADDILVSILDCSGNVIGWYDNLNLISNEIDISALSASTYPCIKAKTTLTNNMNIPPSINTLTVNWMSLSQYLLILEWNSFFIPWQNNAFSLKYSLSYVDDQDVVIYAQLSDMTNGNITWYTPPYSQDLDMIFVSAEQ